MLLIISQQPYIYFQTCRILFQHLTLFIPVKILFWKYEYLIGQCEIDKQ